MYVKKNGKNLKMRKCKICFYFIIFLKISLEIRRRSIINRCKELVKNIHVVEYLMADGVQ